VFPAQGERVIVISHIFRGKAQALPAPSLVSFGNFHTLKRYFPTLEQAKKWASLLHEKFTKGPAKNPTLSGGQLYLF
jgi:hypothetical protein